MATVITRKHQQHTYLMKTAPNEDSTADGLILLTGDKESETIRNM